MKSNVLKHMRKQMKMSDKTLNELYEKIDKVQKPCGKTIWIKIGAA